MLIKCPKCGASISDSSKVCIKCGCDYRKEYRKIESYNRKNEIIKSVKKNICKICIVSLIVCIFAALLFLLRHKNQEDFDNSVMVARQDYEKALSNLTPDDILDNQYIEEIRMRLNFEDLNNADVREKQVDEITIGIRLDTNFSMMEIKDKIETLLKLDHSVREKVQELKEETGYNNISDNYIKYNGNDICIYDDISIIYNVHTMSQENTYWNYKFSDDYSFVTIEGNKYNIQWNESKTAIQNLDIPFQIMGIEDCILTYLDGEWENKDDSSQIISFIVEDINNVYMGLYQTKQEMLSNIKNNNLGSIFKVTVSNGEFEFDLGDGWIQKCTFKYDNTRTNTSINDVMLYVDIYVNNEFMITTVYTKK